MTTTELIRPPRAPSAPKPWTDERRNTPRSASEHPTSGGVLAEILPLIGVVAVAGPPVVFLAGPLLLLVLMLVGPFALLCTFIVLLVAATVLVALTGALVAVGSPRVAA